MTHDTIFFHNSVNVVQEAFVLKYESEPQYQSILRSLDSPSLAVIAELSIHKDELEGSSKEVIEFIKRLRNLGDKFIQINNLCMKSKLLKYAQVKSEPQTPGSQYGVKICIALGYNYQVQTREILKLLGILLPQYDVRKSLDFGWDIGLERAYKPLLSKIYSKSETDKVDSIMGFKELSYHEICIVNDIDTLKPKKLNVTEKIMRYLMIYNN